MIKVKLFDIFFTFWKINKHSTAGCGYGLMLPSIKKNPDPNLKETWFPLRKFLILELDVQTGSNPPENTNPGPSNQNMGSGSATLLKSH